MTGFRAAERRACSRSCLAGAWWPWAAASSRTTRRPSPACFTLLVPVTFETYRERLLADTTRPRLRPGMSLEEELASVYHRARGRSTPASPP